MSPFDNVKKYLEILLIFIYNSIMLQTATQVFFTNKMKITGDLMHLYDYHTHSAHSEDAFILPSVMIETAIARGLKEIAITDHVDFTAPKIRVQNRQFDFDEYVRDILSQKEMYYGKINVKLGAEMGIRFDLGDVISDITAVNPFDFVLGSMHDVAGEEFSKKKFFVGRDKNEA